MEKKNFNKDFFEVQRRQWKISIFLFAVMVLFYFAAFTFIGVTGLLSVGLFLSVEIIKSVWFIKILLGGFVIAFLVALIHFQDAYRYGGKFILERLRAIPPDPSDRYHKMYANLVQEIRIAAGLPKVLAYIFPSFAINSMAVIDENKTPVVIVTEGLLADCTRDELQAVVAHELAHVIRGDTFYMTLVCSIANIFEKIREAFEEAQEDQRKGTYGEHGGGIVGPFLMYVAVIITSISVNLLSTLISRQREVMADAAAVEISRNPLALARVIYKAHLKYSFVGDFNQTYSPLFIVSPESGPLSDGDGFFPGLFSTHPPLMKRLDMIASMANTSSAQIIDQVWEIQTKRDKAKGVLHSFVEITKGKEMEKPVEREVNKDWSIRDSRGQWQGPFSLEDMLFLPFFTPLIQIRNVVKNIEGPAREFDEIRQALGNIGRNKPVNPSGANKCFHCNIPLVEGYYEGVKILACKNCGGKLVNADIMERILSRKEMKFSEELIKKAHDFKKQFLLNPIKTKNLKGAQSISCPNCGSKMLPRPYNYQYFIPIDRCMNCNKIWFDADEMEILQILIEEN